MIEAPDKHQADPAPTPEKPRCKGTTKGGQPCQSPLLGPDGYCVVHSPTRHFDPVEAGRKGGQRSAIARRAPEKNGAHPTRDGRERLREDFERDSEAYAKLKAVYDEAREAVTTCPSCKERALPDHRVRIAAGDSFLAQIYGKPKQNVEGKHEHTLIVFNRLSEALERGADIELPAGDVAEIVAHDTALE